MKIIIESSCAIESPPQAYGGLEGIAYLQAYGLAQLGQEVTLVATKKSFAPEGVELIETVPVGGSEEEAYKVYRDRLKDFDLCISHSWQKYPYMYKIEKDPNYKIMGVVHSPCPYRTAPPVRFPCFVGVSEAHAKYLGSRLQIPVRHVYNGISLEMYPFQPDVSVRKRYLSLNRIMAEKGIHNFIDVVRRARAFGDVLGEDRLLIPDIQYVERIRNLCDGYHVRFFGRVNHEDKVKFLQNAKATIALYNVPYIEIFGLMCVESLACGTPVITLKGIGGPEEIVENGKQGFICETPDDIVEVIKSDKVSEISPEACRERASSFSYAKMAERYLELAKEVVSGTEW